MGRYRGKTLITRYQASCEPHDVTSTQLSIVVWKMSFHSSCYLNISISLVSVWYINFVLFNSMLKYVINRSMRAFFHIRIVIIPNLYLSLISISLVSVWEVHYVLFNSMLKYVIHRLMHAFFHIRAVVIPRPITLSRDDNSPDMEKGMH